MPRELTRSPFDSRRTSPERLTVRAITACRHCAGLIALDMRLDTHAAPQSSDYVCPHCGDAGHVTLPGAVVRAADAVARPVRALAS